MRIPPSAMLFALTNAASLKMESIRRVAVIGAGAGGLITADVLRGDGFEVRIFEKEMNVGGVWKYRETVEGSPSTPMYRSLRTNLPKQIMAYGDTAPFPDAAPSFLSHQDVQTYLEHFAEARGLRPLIRFGSTVDSIDYIPRSLEISYSGDSTILKQNSNGEISNETSLPRTWRVVTSSSSSSPSPPSSSAHNAEEGMTLSDIKCGRFEEYFDAVIICNGHYNIPLTPDRHTSSSPEQSEQSEQPEQPEGFGGEVVHSVDYDTPDRYEGKSVLVVGSKSSGTDLAREIASVASVVYVSDRSLKPDSSAVRFNIHHKPSIATLNPKEIDASVVGSASKGLVQFADGSVVRVDVIVWCTGYAYDYPFLPKKNTEEEKGERDEGSSVTVEVVNKRKVDNLYQQVFSISHPTLAFVGLPYSVVPFPLFSLQAKWISAVYSGKRELPSKAEQLDWLHCYKSEILVRYKGNRELANEKFHYLGDAQWAYQRFLAHSAGVDNEKQMKYIDVTEQIYNDNSFCRPPYPGAPDTYRDGEYSLELESLSWRKIK